MTRITSQCSSDQLVETQSFERWAVVTDLDGTLLDRNYAVDDAASAVDQVRAAWPMVESVVLATSKTLSELRPLAALIERAPVLVFENGAGYELPQSNGDTQDTSVALRRDHACSYEVIRDKLIDLRERNNWRFRGFGDMEVAELCELTGLDSESARRAKERSASEPLVWSDSAAHLDAFREALEQEELSLVRGGQFHHVSSPVDKWEAVRRWRDEHCPSLGILACGDAPNDAQMLRSADRAIVFPDANGGYLLPASRVLFHAEAPGPKSWGEAVNNVMTELTSSHEPKIKPMRTQ